MECINRLSELNEFQQAFLVKAVNDKHGYIPIEELKKKFVDRFPDSSSILINKDALLRLYFVFPMKLVVADDRDITKEFSHLITNHFFY